MSALAPFFVTGGVDFVLSDRPHPPKPRKLDGKQEAFLIATACSQAPEGRTRWTLKLLAERIVSLGCDKVPSTPARVL
ncbi:helix-turn-helix domain-containing protein [Tolypothrix sp. NIES-4075]|uniref:helix-turn-helix domain-containing protein n=1 Tax=Tolypothrix sp. NIES-4075 TaxID=2005459 RepID=UPI000B5C93DA